MADAILRELRKLAKTHGFRVRLKMTGSGHYQLVHKRLGKKVTAPRSVSDWRGMKNLEAQLRRIDEGRN